MRDIFEVHDISLEDVRSMMNLQDDFQFITFYLEELKSNHIMVFVDMDNNQQYYYQKFKAKYNI